MYCSISKPEYMSIWRFYAELTRLKNYPLPLPSLEILKIYWISIRIESFWITFTIYGIKKTTYKTLTLKGRNIRQPTKYLSIWKHINKSTNKENSIKYNQADTNHANNRRIYTGGEYACTNNHVKGHTGKCMWKFRRKYLWI